MLNRGTEPVRYTPVRNRIKGQRPTRLAVEFTRSENDQTRVCNWCPQVLGKNCGHKFLSDRHFIAHLLSKEIEAGRHVILSEQEMLELNRTLEKEKTDRNAKGGEQKLTVADLLDRMNQMKGEIMGKLNEIKSQLETQMDRASEEEILV